MDALEVGKDSSQGKRGPMTYRVEGGAYTSWLGVNSTPIDNDTPVAATPAPPAA